MYDELNVPFNLNISRRKLLKLIGIAGLLVAGTGLSYLLLPASEVASRGRLKLRLAVPIAYKVHSQNALIIQDQLKRVGIEVELDNLEWASWLRDVYRGRSYQLTTIGHTGRLDPHERLYHTFNSGSPENYINYYNPLVDELLDRAASELEFSRRKRLYESILKQIADDVAILPICVPDRVILMREQVNGFNASYPYDIYVLKDVVKYGNDRLIIATDVDVQGLDPWRTVAASTFYVTSNIYDTLLRSTTDWKLAPSLAYNWEVGKDGLSYTFYLRKGVKFHNGRELVAKDVEWSFQWMMDESSPYLRKGELERIDSVEATDRYTVKFTLDSPYAPFLATLAAPWTAILPREEVEKMGDLKKNPVGTGPFRFKEWVPESHVRLVKNDSYWEQGLPKLREVVFKVIPEPTSKVSALISGDVDVVTGFVPPEIADKASLAEGVRAEAFPGTIIIVLAFNNKEPPLNDVNVRRAIAHAINKDEIVDSTFGGRAKKVGVFLQPQSPYYTDYDPYPYDPEKARELLKQSGYRV